MQNTEFAYFLKKPNSLRVRVFCINTGNMCNHFLPKNSKNNLDYKDYLYTAMYYLENN